MIKFDSITYFESQFLTMKIFLTWFILSSFFISQSSAQIKNTAPKPIRGSVAKTAVNKEQKPVIKDSFAFNILTTIDRVLTMGTQLKSHPLVLGSELVKTNNDGVPLYRSIIQFPNGGDAFIKPDGVNRKEGFARWEWQGFVYQFPKGQQTALLNATENKLDSLVKAFASWKSPEGFQCNISVRNWINKSYLEKDELSILVTIYRKQFLTEQQAMDSIVQLYRPLLSNAATAGTCSRKFTGALELEGIERPKIRDLFITEMKAITDKDIAAGLAMLIGAPSFIDVKEAATHLSSAQQNEFKTRAKKIVDDFYEEQRKGPPAKDVVVAQKKEIEKVKPPADPCERLQWETGVKVGNLLEVNGKASYVTDFSCTQHTYTITYIENNKLQFRRGITKEEIKKYPKSYAYSYTICGRCAGQGHSMEYDWYQMNVGSGFYARSNKQRKYSCGICNGAGYLKIR